MNRSARRKTLEYSACAFVATLVAGCSGTTDEQACAHGGGSGEGRAASNGAEPYPTENTKALDLRGVDYEGLLQFIESHQGHPIVLDIWSTSCDPCIRELPNLAQLQDDYRDQGVVCASFNIDFTGAEGTTHEEAQERAREILAALGVRVHNLYATVSDKELYRTELFRANGVYSIPAILIVDPSGNVVGKHGASTEGKSPYSDVRRQVDSLLKDG